MPYNTCTYFLCSITTTTTISIGANGDADDGDGDTVDEDDDDNSRWLQVMPTKNCTSIIVVKFISFSSFELNIFFPF